MRQTRWQNLRYGVLAVAAVLIAAPGVHVFELWLDHTVAFWVSHVLAFGSLVIVAWRWRVARARPAPANDSAA